MTMNAASPVRGSRFPGLAALAVAAVVLSGCATRPDTRTDYDRTADFSSFETYGFPEELGTDRAGYSTLITTHFKQAVHKEMQSRGYRFVEDDPDLLVNFFANVRHVTSLRPRTNVWVGYGYYGYRYGMYTAWPLYAERADTVHYRVGTANIDIVDAERKQLIWEGVAEGKLTREMMENPQPAIEEVVAELFSHFPGRAPGHAAD